jgi:hypothetical protein
VLHEGQLLLSYLPTALNPCDPLVQALFSDQNGFGALANECENLKRFIDYHSHAASIQEHYGSTLDSLALLFTTLKRYTNESDDAYRTRITAVMTRNNASVWGTKGDISRFIAHYLFHSTASSLSLFHSALSHPSLETLCFILENTDHPDNNLLPAGDFEESQNPTELWTLHDNACIKEDIDRVFTGLQALFIEPEIRDTEELEAVAEQSIELSAGVYTLHYFVRGPGELVVLNSSGQYYNANYDVLAWQDEPFSNALPYTPPQFYKEWSDRYFFIKLPLDDTITVRFINNSNTVCLLEGAMRLGSGSTDPHGKTVYEKESYFGYSFPITDFVSKTYNKYTAVFDHVQLFHKLPYPSCTALVYYEDYQTVVNENVIRLAAGDEDDEPEVIPNYKKQSYYHEKNYIYGRAGTFTAERLAVIFNMVKPLGIRLFYEQATLADQ